MDAFLQKLSRLEHTLASHELALKEVQQLLADDSLETSRTPRGGEVSGTSSTAWVDLVASPARSSSPGDNGDLANSLQLKPTENSSNGLRVKALQAQLSQVERSAEHANGKLSKLFKVIDRQDLELSELRSKIIWAQVECSHSRCHQEAPHGPHHHSAFHQGPYHAPTCAAPNVPDSLSTHSPRNQIFTFEPGTPMPERVQRHKQAQFGVSLSEHTTHQKSSASPRSVPNTEADGNSTTTPDLVNVGQSANYNRRTKQLQTSANQQTPPGFGPLHHADQQHQCLVRHPHQHLNQGHQYQQQQMVMMMGPPTATQPLRHTTYYQPSNQLPFVVAAPPPMSHNADVFYSRLSTETSSPGQLSVPSNSAYGPPGPGSRYQHKHAILLNGTSVTSPIALPPTCGTTSAVFGCHDNTPMTVVEEGVSGRRAGQNVWKQTRLIEQPSNMDASQTRVDAMSLELTSSNDRASVNSRPTNHTSDLDGQPLDSEQLVQEIICRAKQHDASKREEWYEHKMRLLKQDKRRRGETIGKLLRCLDDMKDQGRLEENRVNEGRLVLAATINSRGLSMEDRIHAAVEAMEAERAAQRVQHVIHDGTENCSPDDSTSLLEVDDLISTPSRGSVTTSLSATMTSHHSTYSPVAASLSTEPPQQILNVDSKPEWKINVKHFEPSNGNVNQLEAN